uniref:Uncharacterized protein n=1 Tax=Pipistrellus kuhlii TaxID=59472 RepID=A0A7J8A7Y0_PIPKU|nr:hypothetical protein mPipKuh1_008835 [Pipistrellus kuhlii]
MKFYHLLFVSEQCSLYAYYQYMHIIFKFSVFRDGLEVKILLPKIEPITCMYTGCPSKCINTLTGPDGMSQWLNMNLYTRRSRLDSQSGLMPCCGLDLQCEACRRQPINDSLSSLMILFFFFFKYILLIFHREKERGIESQKSQ